MAKETKKQEYVDLENWDITRVHEYRRSRNAKPLIFFDMVLNGIHVYGCTVATRKNGDEFISFPSQKSTNGDGKYYNYAYAYLSSEDQKAIIDEVYKQLDDQND